MKAIAQGTEAQFIVGATANSTTNSSVTLNAELALEGETAFYIGMDDLATNVVKFPAACTEGIKAQGYCVIAEAESEFITVKADHSYESVVTAPTCTEAGYTTYTCACGDSYTADEVAATGHSGYDADYKCDVCSAVVEPEADTALTVAQAIELAKALGANNFSTNKYYLTVTIESVYNTEYGNANVTDENGDKYVIYGMYQDGTRYDKLTYKPVKGDKLTVYAAVGSYQKNETSSITYQMKNVDLEEIVAHTHNYDSVVTKPTCTADGYTTHICSICADTYKDSEVAALGHTTENGTCENCGKEISAENPGLTEKSYSYTMTKGDFSGNGTKALNGVNWTFEGESTYFGWDSNSSAKGVQFGSGSAPNKSMNFTSESFSNVSKIVINTSGAKSIAGSCKVYVGETLVDTITLTATATDYTIELSEALSGEVRFEYTQTSSKAIYIKSIAVDYAE